MRNEPEVESGEGSEEGHGDDMDYGEENDIYSGSPWQKSNVSIISRLTVYQMLSSGVGWTVEHMGYTRIAIQLGNLTLLQHRDLHYLMLQDPSQDSQTQHSGFDRGERLSFKATAGSVRLLRRPRTTPLGYYAHQLPGLTTFKKAYLVEVPEPETPVLILYLSVEKNLCPPSVTFSSAACKNLRTSI